MGGVDSVRGYYEREVANDIGWRLSLEAYSPDFGTWFGKTWRARALVFADAARGHDSEPPQNPTASSAASAWGFARTRANPLRSGSTWRASRRTRGTRQTGDWRAHFAAAYSY